MCSPQRFIIPLMNGYSFYRCKQHKPTTPEENKAKEEMLVRLVLDGMYRSLRYVRAGTT
jgi:membrane-bound inhibitor of C-type lysozyme